MKNKCGICKEKERIIQITKKESYSFSLCVECFMSFLAQGDNKE